MQTQGSQASSNDPIKRSINPEMPLVLQNEITVPPEEDISGLARDERELAKIEAGVIPSADGSKIFTTLRMPAEAQVKVLPTEQTVESLEQNQTRKEIENIMSAGLAEYDKKSGKFVGVYADLPPDRRELLKKEGEKTAGNIEAMMISGKFDPEEIQILFKEWLKIIPGVNRPWVEQEATIKKDQIQNLYKQLYLKPI